MVNLYERLPEWLNAMWWNSQYTRSIITWDYGKKGTQDVRNSLVFSDDDNAAIDTLLSRIGALPKDQDALVKYVVFRILQLYPQPNCYRTDQADHGVPDYWQSPKETLDLGLGDCDDWGILIYATLRRAGIPAYRLKCCVTNVTNDDGSNAGLHFDVIYLDHEHYEWYVLEGSWYPDFALTEYQILPRKFMPHYGPLVFTFNESNAWAQTDFKIKPSYINPLNTQSKSFTVRKRR